MAYGNGSYGYNRQNNGYSGGGGYSRGNSGYARQAEPKKEFDLADHIATKIDVYMMFQEKAKEAGLEIPPEVLGGWCTSAMLSMEK